MASKFIKATEVAKYLKVLLAGATGAGKTWTALQIAEVLSDGDWGKVGVIDTDCAAQSYSHGRPFNILQIEDNYSLDVYFAALKSAQDAKFPVVILDGITPLWNGKGGCLEEVAMRERAATGKNGSFSAWNYVTPRLNEFVQRVRTFPAHLIITVRAGSKLTETAPGKFSKVPDHLLFRENTIEFEMDVTWLLSADHSAHVLKDRTGFWDGKIPKPLTPEDAAKLKQWAGVPDAKAVAKKDATVDSSIPMSLAEMRAEYESHVRAYYGAGLLSKGAVASYLAVTDDRLEAGINYFRHEFAKQTSGQKKMPAGASKGSMYDSMRKEASHA